MPQYVFTYHQPKGYVPGTDADAMAAWQSYFEDIADHIVDPGKPVFDRRAVGEIGDATQLGGYTVIDARDMDEAIALAQGCPSLQRAGGVQVGELADLPEDHIASQLATKVARA